MPEAGDLKVIAKLQFQGFGEIVAILVIYDAFEIDLRPSLYGGQTADIDEARTGLVHLSPWPVTPLVGHIKPRAVCSGFSLRMIAYNGSAIWV